MRFAFTRRAVLPLFVLGIGLHGMSFAAGGRAQSVTSISDTTAERLYKAGRFAQARDAYKQALKRTPNDPVLQAGLVLCLSRLDEWQQALDYATKAAALAPQNADAHGLLAFELLRAGQPAGAEREAASSLALDPQNYWGLITQGRLALWNGQKRQAREILRRAAQSRPDAPDAWFYLVDAFEDDVTPELLADIDAYIALKPTGHPHAMALEALPALRSYLNYFVPESPYTAFAPTSEAQLKAADISDAPPVTFRVPFERSGDYVTLPTLVDGHKLRLLFDTGGGFSIALNKTASKKLNLKPLGQSIVRGVSGKEASTEARADTMTFGGETFRAIPIDILTGDVGAEDGVFGVSNFDHYAVTIDFAEKNIVLARGKNAAAPAPLPGRQTLTLPFHDLGGDIIVPITIEGRDIWALVDTGADGDLILSLDTARGVAARRKRSAWDTRVITDRLGLGSSVKKQNILFFRDPVAVQVGELAGKPFVTRIQPAYGADLIDTQVNPAAMFQVGAILGINFLNKAARVTFDYPHHLLTLEYAPRKSDKTGA